MATKTAKKKAAKKATAKAIHKVWKMTIASDGTFVPNPLNIAKRGDHVKFTIPKNKDVTIKIASIQVDPEGGGGGPIIITS